VADADVVLHLTEWHEFGEADPAVIAPMVNSPLVVDARNTLDPARWRAAGWSYHALGRPTVEERGRARVLTDLLDFRTARCHLMPVSGRLDRFIPSGSGRSGERRSTTQSSVPVPGRRR
jgi:hypothetical protein